MKRAIRLFIFIIFLILLWNGISSGGQKVFFYHTDPAGTPLAMTDEAAKVVWRGEYKPFGEEYLITETVGNDHKFVGKEQDQETGLYYFGARYMEPMIGRFISTDPVGPVDPASGKVNMKVINSPQGLNHYAYALNNPYRYVDPDGRIWVTVSKKERTILNILERYVKNYEKTSKGYGGPEMIKDLKEWGEAWQRGERPDLNDKLGDRRILEQEWREDPDHPERNPEYDIGTRRYIEQNFTSRFKHGPNSTEIIYEWTPNVPDRTYENGPAARIDRSYVKPENRRHYLEQQK
jgi:RHS repeat-associated protein